MGDRIFIGLTIQNVDALPTAGKRGLILCLTTDGHFYGDNGTSWDDLSYIRTVITVTEDYIITQTLGEIIVLADTSVNSSLIDIYTPDVDVSNIKITVKKIDGAALNVRVNVASSIDGNSRLNLASQFDSITFVSDGVNWQIVGFVGTYSA